MSRPDLCQKGTVLYVGMLPPSPGGSSIVNRNLLDQFSPASVVAATTANRDRHAIAHDSDVRTHEILRSPGYSRRLSRMLFRIQVPRAAKRLATLARDVDAMVIVGSYPIRHLLEVTRLAAREVKIPWVAYLHDTLTEAASHSPDSGWIEDLQDAVFSEASHLMVMSQGMADLYRDKYDGLATTPLEHIYPLDVPSDLPTAPSENKVFWAGNVYNINARSFGRVATAAKRVGIEISTTTTKELSTLEDLGIDTSAIERVYYPDWSDYLDALNAHEILLLALDWPDESPIHRDELATIFPTKTPEYLASGRPILVHCPDDYFLARFFRDHECGTIVSDRSTGALEEAIRAIRGGGIDIREKSRNGFSALDRFRPDRIQHRFKTVVDEVSGVRWGEKVGPMAF